MRFRQKSSRRCKRQPAASCGNILNGKPLINTLEGDSRFILTQFCVNMKRSHSNRTPKSCPFRSGSFYGPLPEAGANPCRREYP
jgi:hypothetical protein